MHGISDTSALATQSYADTAGGLVHIHTQSFTGVSSVSVDSVFSATYESYKVIVNINSITSGTTNIRQSMRASGVDNSSSLYYSAFGYHLGGAWTTSRQIAVSNGFDLIANNGIGFGHATIDQIIVEPYQPQRTEMGFNLLSSVHYSGAAAFLGTTAFDGFTLTSSSGTISGTIRVYGYRS